MERIIEYPRQKNYVVDISSTEPVLPEGYCICYQYDVNPEGYGPYGFETDTAKTLPRKTFEPLLYWNNTRQKLVEASTPQGSGLFFKKNQMYVKALEHELSEYHQAMVIKNLRIKYGKDVDEKEIHITPLLKSISKEGRIPPLVISNLIANGCEFFLGNIEVNTGGLHLVFFDIEIKENIRFHAKAMNVDYCVFETIEELKVW